MSQRSALRNPNFLLYFAGSVVTLHGLWIFRVALGWYAWELTGSEAWVGIIAFTQFAPALLFGPFFGVLADRFERRWLSVAINTGGLINMGVLSFLTASGHVDIVTLALGSTVQGMLDGAHSPVRMSLVPSIVPRSQLGSAIASTSIAFNASRVIGPALSGLIIFKYGVATAFAINGISYLAYVLAVIKVDIERRQQRGTGEGNVWNQMLEGINYVRGNDLIRTLLLAISINTVFGRGALEMMPAVADGVLARGSAGLATLTSAVGGGALLLGATLARGSGWLQPAVIKASVIASSLLIIAFGASSNFAVTVALVAGLGFTLSLCGVGSQILIQSHVDDEVRGRVSSLWGVIAFGFTSLGGLFIGLLSSLAGLQATLMATGALCLLTILLLRVGDLDQRGK